MKILGEMKLLTPATFLNSLTEFGEAQEGSGNSLANFLVQTPASGALYGQLTWAGKLGASRVMRSIYANKDPGWF